ncbi:MAG: methionyl-tRNA formyltransferase [Nitrospirae bacterium RBG_13_39_12]|nr:MAG: methionyl-tRNA formyltransferase [Nitrospirae bacterium RBG_13_39_12]
MHIVFFGTPAFAIPSLNALLQSGENVKAVVTQPDKRKGRGHILSKPPVKEFADQKGIKVLQPFNVNDPLFLKELSDMMPEIIVVVAYGRILPVNILRLPLHGCINVHASLLPKYRGAAPIQWAIINGEKKTGITIMLMDKGLDTGDILIQEETEIHDDDNTITLGERLTELGASLLIKSIKGIKNTSIKPIPQKGLPSYAPPLKKDDGRLNWSNTAKEIFNFVRGMYPWPCAYCYLNKERIKITRVMVIEGSGLPGRVEKANDAFVVGTGEGLISIIELQPEGKMPMSSKAFLQGRRLKEGAFFDET